MAFVQINTKQITDRASFHQVCKEAFGFFDGYGRNMDAWIDCMSYLEDDDGMTKFCLQKDEILYIEITETEGFNKRQPEIFNDLIECTAFVNQRYIEDFGKPRIALLFF
jgi:RNAse (barnase) inhibitor barstar